MKKIIFFTITVIISCSALAQTGRVGIGINTPAARLHVIDSSVLFSASGSVSLTPGNTPLNGAGRRMMWYADKAAFRAGYVSGTQWDKNNIGYYSFATGENTIASGLHSFASGNGNDALNDYAAAIGVGNTASGSASWAQGSSNSALESFTAVFGSFNTARGRNSFVTGVSNISQSYSGFIAGHYNDTSVTGSISQINPLNRIFQIGNGTTNTARSNAMTVLQNGSVGIGTTTPSSKAILDISSSNKGFLPPRITEDSMNAMGSVTPGMVIYNTTRNCMMVYSNAGWDCLTSGSSDKFHYNAAAFYSDADSSITSEIVDMAAGPNCSYFVTGTFLGVKLDLGNGVVLTAPSGLSSSTHGFIARYDSIGNCNWAVKLLCTSNNDLIRPEAITVNDAGSAFITGGFTDSIAIYHPNGVFFNSLVATDPLFTDIFLLKLLPNGTVDWCRQENSPTFIDNKGMGITLSGDRLWLCGQFSGIINFGVITTVSLNAGAGNQDGFYVQYDTATGLHCYYGNTISASGPSFAKDIAVKTTGGSTSIYVTGAFEGSVSLGLFVPTPSLGGKDMFVAKYNYSSIFADWVLFARGNGNEEGVKLKLEGSNVYVANIIGSNAVGFQHQPANALVPPGQSTRGGKDIMVFRVDTLNGLYFSSSWITTMGGTDDDIVKSLDVNASTCLVAGEFSNSMQFKNGYPLYTSGSTDGFMGMLHTPTGNLYKAATVSSFFTDRCNAAVLGTNNAIAIAGGCSQSVTVNGTAIPKPPSNTVQAFITVLK